MAVAVFSAAGSSLSTGAAMMAIGCLPARLASDRQ
jgi:hypothetical protein